MIIACPHCGGLNRISDEKLNQNPTCGKCQSALFSGKPIEMNSEQFNRVMEKTDLPMIVDFWATWCGPCQSFAPTFSAAAKQLEPYARLVKVNTETEQAIAAKYNIRSIPTLAIFKNGQEVTRMSGAMNLNQFIEWSKNHL